MSINRAEAVDRQFVTTLEQAGGVDTRHPGVPAGIDPRAPIRNGTPLTGAKLLDLFESMVICRHLDLVARKLRALDKGYYTIGSAGHEGNVVVGDVVRHTDPAFLHYRSGALMAQRSRKVEGIDNVRDTLLGMMASTDDPIAGGRHKVWGSVPLWVPPQTSTIASHLPKAMGAAMAINRARKLRLALPVPDDSIVLCTFGDASVNHSVAQGAFNSASWLAHQRIPTPILFVCEDNGRGISVRTPPDWIEASFRNRHGIMYVKGDGLDLADAYEAASRAVRMCREGRVPVFLHLRTIRMLGHAGSDVETTYRTLQEVEAEEALDPVLKTALRIVDLGLLDARGVLGIYESVRERVWTTAEDAMQRRQLRDATEVMETLAPYTPARVEAEATRLPGAEVVVKASKQGARHFAVLMNRALHEAMVKYPQAIVFGEDVAKKGGVYHLTADLFDTFGPARVFNTPLDETSILGTAIGAAHLGFLPIPEIQYLAYFHNAEDQIRSEACSLQFFSRAQFSNPMVVRIAGFAYQRGFGGHFHNDNSIAVLRDIPSLIVAAPSRGDDAARMLRTALALAKVDGRVVAFLEPIALYMTKDLYEPGDGQWQFEFPAAADVATLGEPRVYHEDATDLTIVTYANGAHMSLRAARELERDHGIRARVVDLRWLAPLNVEAIAREARATGRALVVDECRRSGGFGEAIIAAITEHCGNDVATSLLTADDTYIPLGPAMRLVMPDEAGIVAGAKALAARELVVDSDV